MFCGQVYSVTASGLFSTAGTFKSFAREETFLCRGEEVLRGCGLLLKNADPTNRVDHRCEGET